MKNTFIATAIMAALACGLAFAQGTPPAQPSPSTSQEPQGQPPGTQTQSPASARANANQAQPAGSPRIAPGSVIPVELTKTVDAKKAKTGDEVVAKVAQDMKTSTGEVLLPKDTKVIGHVTEAQARSKEQKESQLGIAFDHAVMKSGDVQLPMSIQAVIAPPSNTPGNNAGYDQSAPASAGGTASGGGMGGSRAGSSSASPQSQSQPSTSMPAPNPEAKEGGSTGERPPVTGNTQGVVGISNLKLEAAQNAAQGSLMSSEKNNVKLESGTFMLLRVQQ
jgi:hypothetical protein